MSYILDALKKSESERLRQDAPGFADVPGQLAPRRTPIWIWLLGGLLVVNAGILASLLLRGFFAAPATPASSPAAQQSAPPTQVAGTRPRNNPDPAAIETPETAEIRKPPPVRTPVNSTPTPVAATQTPPAPRQNAGRVTGGSSATNPAALPQLMDLRAEGRLQLPELHLDIHVYSGAPEDRFVFVNMSKYREAARLADGPLVKEIVPSGVILEYQGITFLLPRD